MTKYKQFAVKICQCKSAILAFIAGAILITGLSPAGALAQCGGDHSGNMGGQQMMGSSGHMGSGQTGMYGTQTPVQPNPVPPPVSGYTRPQDRGAYGQMGGQGGTASGQSGHRGH